MSSDVAMLSVLAATDRKYKKRLFYCQLWHLAWADIVSVSILCVFVLVQFGPKALSPITGDVFCGVTVPLWNWTLVLCSLLETSIVLGFTCAHVRNMQALLIIKKALPFLWPASVFLGVMFTFEAGIWTHDYAYFGKGVCAPSHPPVISFAFLMWCVLFILECFAISAISTFMSSNQAVRSRVWSRNWMYTANFLLSYLYWLIFEGYPNVGADVPWLIVGTVLQLLNGFFNCTVYFVRSRMFRKRVRQWRNIFHERQTVRVLNTCPEHAEEEQRGLGSFHVAINTEATVSAFDLGEESVPACDSAEVATVSVSWFKALGVLGLPMIVSLVIFFILHFCLS